MFNIIVSLMSNLINNKYGYVENIKNEHEYKNIDYRDTIVPLWDTLFNQYYNNEYVSNNDIKQINLALCASIIQLGKLIKTESTYNYNQIHEINRKLEFIEKKHGLLQDKIILLQEKLQLLEKN